MRVISRLYVRIVASPGSIPTRTAPLVIAITGTRKKPVSIKNLNAFKAFFFYTKFKDGDWKMSSKNIMERNDRKVEITNDGGKLTVKAVVAPSGSSGNKWDEIEDIDLRFHRQNKSEEEFTALLRRKLEYRIEIARRIAKLRVRRGLSQALLAQKCGVSQKLIANIEIAYSNATQTQLEKLAKVLGTTVDYLRGNEANPDGDTVLYEGEDLQKAIAIAKMYLASSLEPYDFKAQIETVLEAVANLELNEPLGEILAS